MVALIVASASLFWARADAAVALTLQVTASPNPVIVSNTLTYTINMTNVSGVGLQNVVVSNILTDLVQFTNTTTNVNLFVAGLGTLTNGESVQLSLSVTPIAVETLTNFIFVNDTNEVVALTNVSVSVIATNIPAKADLGVTIGNFRVGGYSSDIFANDRVTYDVIVTNSGPQSATKVFLTNSLPLGIKLLSVSPANQIVTSNNSTVVLNLGTLTNGFSKDYKITFQPTNSGVFPFSAFFSSNNFDSITANNFTSTNVTVLDFLPGTSNLVAYIGSSQVTNRQSGFLEQMIVLSNAGPSQIAAARVIVSGLTNYLANATGTNNGHPFVVEGAPIDPGAIVNLLFRFYPRSAFPFSNSQLQAVEVTPPDFTLPPNLLTTTNTPYLLKTNLPLGQGILIEFPALTNRTYTVAYSDDMSVPFTNWPAAQPSVRATANYILWIDYGPPETLSNSPMRCYRVYLNP